MSSSIEDMFALAMQHGLTPKRWSGSRLVVYNGFDHDHRVRKWQALDLAIRMGLEPPAEKFPCSVCGAPPSPTIAYHSEDYGNLTGHHPVCKGCHLRLHNRYRSPQRWHEFVATVGDGSKWFEKLSVGLVVSSPPARPQSVQAKIHPAALPVPSQAAQFASIRQQMHVIRIAFVRSMGIKSKEMNPDPVDGYKLESDPRRRQQCLDEAQCLREKYAAMVRQSGVGQDVLDKMDSNLVNRDRGVSW